MRRRRTIRVKGKLLVYSPTHKGYIDPEDHSGAGFKPSVVWRFPKRTRKVKRHKHRRLR